MHSRISKVTSPARAVLAQLVRALDCGSRGPPFKPGRRYHTIQILALNTGAQAAPGYKLQACPANPTTCVVISVSSEGIHGTARPQHAAQSQAKAPPVAPRADHPLPQTAETKQRPRSAAIRIKARKMTNGRFGIATFEEARFLSDKLATRLTSAAVNAPSSTPKSRFLQKYVMLRGPKLPPQRLRGVSQSFLKLAHAIDIAAPQSPEPTNAAGFEREDIFSPCKPTCLSQNYIQFTECRPDQADASGILCQPFLGCETLFGTAQPSARFQVAFNVKFGRPKTGLTIHFER